jgi:hypothetical protein
MLKSIFMVQPASNRVGSHFTIGWNFMPPVQVVRRELRGREAVRLGPGALCRLVGRNNTVGFGQGPCVAQLAAHEVASVS